MVPVHAGLCNQLVGLLKVVVQHTRLHGVESVAAHAATAAEATAAATAEAHVVGIVGVGHAHQAVVATHEHAEQAGRVAVLGANAEVGVSHRATVHALTQAEIDDRLLVAVVNAGDTSQVALLVVGANALHNVGGQVLHSRSGVAKLFAVDFDLRHRLTIDLDVAVVVDLSAGQTLHQLFHNRAFGGLKGIGIIYNCVALRIHAGLVLHHYHLLQYVAVSTQSNSAEILRLAGNGDRLHVGSIAYASDAQQETSVVRCRSLEVAVKVGDEVLYQSAVGFQQ